MRWLFLFVFALNLAYIGWGLNQPPADPYANVKPLKNVAAIVLLSELEAESDSSEMLAVQATAAVKQPSEKAGSEVEANVAANVTAPALESLPVAAKAVEAEAFKTSVEKTEVRLASNTVQPAAAAVRSEPVNSEKVTQTNDRATQVAHSCYTLGPFRNLEKLRRLTREIKSYVVSADFRGKEENEQSLYWVYITPEKNRQQAIKTGKRLKAKKIKDFYVIREGEKINGLSLGYFRSKSGATGLVRKVDKLGFDVVLEPVFKTYTVYWLDYQLKDGVEVPASVFEKHISRTKKDKVSLIARDCAG